MADDADAPAASEEAGDAKPPLILAVWLSDSPRGRLAESGEFEITDAPERIDAADLVAVSTRLPKGQSTGVVAGFRAATAKPIVAIAYAGGEDVAVEMLARADGAAPTAQALAAVQEAGGTAFDPDVVKAAVEAFG